MNNAFGIMILTVLEQEFRWMTVGEIRAAIGADDAFDVTAELQLLEATGQVDRQQLVPQAKPQWGIRKAHT
jgi:hypothetical protein